ncbi:sugar hydrolase [Streptomyces zinciresistens K42]|uniref:Sugar hydrolase n=1 Tax=Streptomyces zinciresistens K42 TaxID=700597 RepID=G2GMN6_9ACTN|nr:fibronectin type III domain-containing protein [Streptomyces zinciresistens]EGX55230.1 sugar hydrolase [Streptomyces zinciresistens K42]
MRRALVPLSLLCAALLPLTSCAWTGSAQDEGRMPGIPRGVTAQAGSATSVHVMWNAVAAPDGVRGYEVYRGGTKVKDVPAAERMADVVRLTPSTSYVFTVRARDRKGRLGPPSREVRAKTPRYLPADRSAPTRPGKAAGRVVASRAVQLSWAIARDDRDVVSYDIYQSGVKIHSVSGNQTAAVVTGLRPGQKYSFTVRARDAADNRSVPSAAVPLTTPGKDDGRGTAPTAFQATTRRAEGAYYLDLSWVPPRADGVIAEYQIQLDGRDATSLVFGGNPPGERVTYSTYLTPDTGVSRRVRVRARLPDGTWGGFSAERSVTTSARL